MPAPSDAYGAAEYARASTTSYLYVSGGTVIDAKGVLTPSVPAGGVTFTGPRLFNSGPANSMTFDGVSGRIQCGDVLDMTGTTARAYVIVGRMDAAASASYTRLIDKSRYVSDADRDGHFVALSTAGLRFSRINDAEDAAIGTLPAVGQVFHLYLGYGATNTLELCMNGGTLVQATSSLSILDIAEQFTIGATAGGGNNFNGLIPAVTVGNARLSRAEIDASYASFLAQPNPAPVATTVTPHTIGKGAGNTNITITGSNFGSTSTVRVNGVTLTTVGTPTSTSITATIPSSTLLSPAYLTANVVNVDGQISNNLTIAVTAVLRVPVKASPLGPLSTRTIVVTYPNGWAYEGPAALAGYTVTGTTATTVTLLNTTSLAANATETPQLLFLPPVGWSQATANFSATITAAGDVDTSNNTASVAAPVTVPAVAAGNAWYVHPTTGNDSNAGTLAAPLLTLAAGLAKLSQAGDVLYLRGGTYPYNTNNRATFTKSGASGNPIVIRAYPSEVPLFTGTNAAGPNWMNVQASYVKIQGIRLDHWGQNYLQDEAALRFQSGIGCEARDMDCRDNGYAGIKIVSGSTNGTVAGGNFQGNVVGVNIDTAGGWTIGGPTLADGNTAHDNNKMCRNGGDKGLVSPDTGVVEPAGEHGGQGCAVLYVASGTTIVQNNTFYNNHASSASYTWDGSSIENYLSPNTKIRGNFTLNDVNFCEHAGDASGVEVTRNIAINGALWVAHQSTGALIAHNTNVIWSSGLPAWQQAWYPFWFGAGGGVFGNGDTSNMRIVNNIFDSPNTILAVFSRAFGTNVTIDNNLYRLANTFSVQYNGTTYNSLAAWRTASGKDANSVTGTPGFVNATGTTRADYALASSGSPAVNIGRILTGVNDGYLGTAPDAGSTEKA